MYNDCLYKNKTIIDIMSYNYLGIITEIMQIVEEQDIMQQVQ